MATSTTELSEHQSDLPSSSNRRSLTNVLIDECNAMAEFSISSGLTLEPTILESLHNVTGQQSQPLTSADIKILAGIHKSLSRTIAPATPNGTVLLRREKARKHRLNFLGPVALIRQLMITTLILLMVMIGVGLHHDVNYQTIAQGILHSEGLKLFLNLIFILACAGLGGCFSALYRLNQYIISANYDPKYDSTYWVRLLLGVISGLFVVELIPLSVFHGENGDVIQSFSKPALAMLGGFSATMVYCILQRVVDAAESLVTGDQRSLEHVQTQLRKGEMERYKQELHFNVSGALKALEDQLGEGNTENAQALINKTLTELLPEPNAQAQL